VAEHLVDGYRRKPVPQAEGPWDTRWWRAGLLASVWGAFLMGAAIGAPCGSPPDMGAPRSRVAIGAPCEDCEGDPTRESKRSAEPIFADWGKIGEDRQVVVRSFRPWRWITVGSLSALVLSLSTSPLTFSETNGRSRQHAQ
jgi:hypothetical protein